MSNQKKSSKSTGFNNVKMNDITLIRDENSRWVKHNQCLEMTKQVTAKKNGCTGEIIVSVSSVHHVDQYI